MLFKSKSKYDYVIIGLGNPGDKYVDTRHNVGFRCIDVLAEDLGVRIEKNKFKSLICDAQIANKKVMLCKPLTFMNNSGTAASEIVKLVDSLLLLRGVISQHPPLLYSSGVRLSIRYPTGINKKIAHCSRSRLFPN